MADNLPNLQRGKLITEEFSILIVTADNLSSEDSKKDADVSHFM